MVAECLNRLISGRFLARCDAPCFSNDSETSLDIFYWNFGVSSREVNQKLNRHRIVIQGVNCISYHLATAMKISGWEDYEVVDDPALRNLSMFDNAGLITTRWANDLKWPLDYKEWTNKTEMTSSDCLVATSDFGAIETMRAWNRYCVEQHCHFLPIVLKNGTGYVGPFVVPDETPCFECVQSRQNANLDDPEMERASEAMAFEGQKVVGFHPAMASILGDIAALELTKFYSDVLPRRNNGVLIEVNLLIPTVRARKILKIPRCIVCSALKKQPPKTPFKSFWST
jgi:thiazole/oxazole-forming peptide maturase SagC family component